MFRFMYVEWFLYITGSKYNLSKPLGVEPEQQNVRVKTQSEFEQLLKSVKSDQQARQNTWARIKNHTDGEW